MVNFTVIRRSNLPVVQLEEDSGSNFFQHIPEEYIPGNYVVQHSLLKGAVYNIYIRTISSLLSMHLIPSWLVWALYTNSLVNADLF